MQINDLRMVAGARAGQGVVAWLLQQDAKGLSRCLPHGVTRSTEQFPEDNMSVLSMPPVDAAAQRKRVWPDKPCSRPLPVPPAAMPSVAMGRKAMIEPGAEGPQALLVRASEGLRIVRGSAVLPAGAGCLLRVGDRLVVPDGGAAQAVFQEHDGQALLGTFGGGTDASLAYFSKDQGACSVVFDLVAGRVDMALSAIGGAAAFAPSVECAPAGRKAVGFYCYSQAIAGR